jgi:hypothetical protein
MEPGAQPGARPGTEPDAEPRPGIRTEALRPPSGAAPRVHGAKPTVEKSLSRRVETAERHAEQKREEGVNDALRPSIVLYAGKILFDKRQVVPWGRIFLETLDRSPHPKT